MIRLEAGAGWDFDAAMRREWLVTNGLGGYASGTVAGANSRRYHGLLVATMAPPGRRMVLLAALEEWLTLAQGELVPLSTQEYWDGTVFPQGYQTLATVELDEGLPVFTWSIGQRTVEKRIWMEEGSNRTVVTYQLLSGPSARLRLQPLFAHRDFHQQRHGMEQVDVLETADGWEVTAGGIRSCVSTQPAGRVSSRPDWYWRVLHRAERERGLDAEEDLFTPGTVELALNPGKAVALVAGTDPLPESWSLDSSKDTARRRQAVRRDRANAATEDELTQQLVRAAAQFRVTPSLASPQAGGEVMARRTVIAGYHWFGEWGRDTMISLPGLTLAAGKTADARRILETFLGFLDQGMLPNYLPDPGQPAEYNTMDATLWLFQAIHAYVEASGDWEFVTAALPQLAEVIQWHVEGTRYHIRMDPADGLLSGGEEGVALTWMDARVGDQVVTPRRGKPIEINALWYNALRLVAAWCSQLGRPADEYADMAQRTRASAHRRFWYGAGGYLYDVVDGPEGDDPSLRPNQILALSLAFPLLIANGRARQVLAVVTDRLLTPFGLRTLDPADPRYCRVYSGDQRLRDGAYHMGIVWPWLLGPYADAHWRIHGDRRAVRELFSAFRDHLAEAGLGTISEIFEPGPPYRPVGCIAQAWSVAEVLRHLVGPSDP